MKLSSLFAPKVDAAAEAEYRRRLYAAYREAGWEHGDALRCTNRDTRLGLWRKAFLGLRLGPMRAVEPKRSRQKTRAGQLTLF